jgi:predicted dehydrogenase
MTTNLYGTSSDDNAVALAEFEGGVIATGETAFVTFGVPDLLEIYGTEGSLFIRGNQAKIATKSLRALGVTEAVPDSLPAPRPMPMLQFLDACLNGTGTPEYLGPATRLT